MYKGKHSVNISNFDLEGQCPNLLMCKTYFGLFCMKQVILESFIILMRKIVLEAKFAKGITKYNSSVGQGICATYFELWEQRWPGHRCYNREGWWPASPSCSTSPMPPMFYTDIWIKFASIENLDEKGGLTTIWKYGHMQMHVAIHQETRQVFECRTLFCPRYFYFKRNFDV